MWFTETPWPPIFIFGAVACVLLSLWWTRRKQSYLGAVIILLVAAVATFFVERAIVSDREQIEQNVLDLTAAFQREDLDATLSHFSALADELRAIVTKAMELVDVQHDLDVKDVQVTMVAQGSQGISIFRANATVSVPSMSFTGHQPSRWKLTWQREGGEWKIVEVIRMDPIQDKELGILDRRQ